MRLFLLPLKLFNSLNLYISCNANQGGLFIQHGFSTVIACRHIGKNCWINQQITIGYSNNTDCPYIDNNVTINAGAILIGNINIGDDIIIGAGAVVVKDVPAHSLVAGVPAKVIKQRNPLNGKWEKIV